MSTRELAVLDLDGREVARVALGDDAVTLGRAEGNTIILEDALASRFHARVEPAEEGHAILDRGSKNGTLVNGSSVKRRVLAAGDEILVGETRLRYEAVGAPEPAEPEEPAQPARREQPVELVEPAVPVGHDGEDTDAGPEPDDETCAEPAYAAVLEAPAPARAGGGGKGGAGAAAPAATEGGVTVLHERPGAPVIPARELAASQANLDRTPVAAEPLPPPGTLEALALFAEALGSLPHELGSLEEVARRLLSLVECERATVLIVEEGTAKPLVQYSRSTMLVESGGGPADEVIQAALTTERPVCIRVPRAHEVLSATLNAQQHLMLVPVRSSGRKLGLVALERQRDQQPFEDEELALVRAASAQVATLLRSVL